ncbi:MULTISPECIES: K(+)-transporting ATPase subunit F [Ectothiorhodospira]|nr:MULTISPECIES: K(+)-transporting ATPase subunit F [Ectothiorhodospira]MBK1672163.1 K(+)-transporting ATPase subunit F [Ectothiorhodospira shaposhnikovii]MCG5501714.1 K(+)-transporting ATPase subunit F [Ectothiorhodospira lacustris]
MTILYTLFGLMAVGLLGYLIYAMFVPEAFL